VGPRAGVDYRAMAYLKVVSRYSPGSIEGKHEKFGSMYLVPVSEFEHGTSEHMSHSLPVKLQKHSSTFFSYHVQMSQV